MRSVLLRVVSLLALAPLAGCGGGGTPVNGQVTFGNLKPNEGDRWTLILADGDKKTYSAEVDASGKFAFEKVAAGTYNVKVTHYVPVKPDSKGAKPPTTADYPDTWTVPGGPYTLDLSKLPKK